MHISRYLFFFLLVSASFCSYAQDKRATDTLLISDSTDEMVDSSAIADTDSNDDYTNEKLVKIRDSFSLREVPDTISDRLKKNKVFAYANDPSYWIKEEEKEEAYRPGFWDRFFEFFSRDAVRAFFYILIALLILFILYRVILVNNLYVFYSSRKNKKIATEEEHVGIESENLDEKINASIAAQEYRMAVRYLYLKSLRLLNDKGAIRYSSEATNYDYIRQTSGLAIGKDFAYLTRAYEYVWYGEFEINSSQFEILFTNFKNLYSSIKI